MNENEKDLSLKLRMMRFLWYNGHFVRKNINLPRYTYGERTSEQYTDVDVLGLRINENFKLSRVMCDCKSGRNVSNADRLFWTSGVMKYINAKNGIFLRRQINETRYFDLARSLNITPLSSERLSELENAYKIDSKPFIGSFNKDIQDEKIFDNLKKLSKEFHHFITSRYWHETTQKQIELLIRFQHFVNKSSLIEEEKMFLQMYGFSLLSISILKFSEPILIFPNTIKANHIKESLLGEGIEIAERKMLLESVYEFVSREVSLKSGKSYSISKEDFMSQIYPSYYAYLVDLIERICLNPVDALQLPRLFDIIAYEFILNNNRDEVKEKLFSYNNNFNLEMTVKLANNFLNFGNRVKFIPKNRFKALNILISGIV